MFSANFSSKFILLFRPLYCYSGLIRYVLNVLQLLSRWGYYCSPQMVVYLLSSVFASSYFSRAVITEMGIPRTATINNKTAFAFFIILLILVRKEGIKFSLIYPLYGWFHPLTSWKIFQTAY